MADIRAFRAFRYDLGRVGMLSDVVCPPYDVIDPALQQALYDRSPYNSVRLEFNKPEPGDTDSSNRYTRSASILRDWLDAEIIRQDTARCLYAYHQEYEVEGVRRVRRGFFARVRLEPFGSGRIYPHEETMSGPKADRLNLYRATGMNLSPIFGLYPDESHEVQQALDDAVGRALPLEAADHLGVVSRLWPVQNQQAISKIVGLMGPKPVFIADGHHRYETGLKYLEERLAVNDAADEEHPARFVLMNLVSMNDPGLLILPTHRLIGGLPGITSEQIAATLSAHFDVQPIGTGVSAARETWDQIQMDGAQGLLGFGTTADGVWHLARFRSPEVMAQLAPGHSDDWRGLGVSILHVLVLQKLLRSKADLPCHYVHLIQEVIDSQTARSCDLAVLVPPATMAHVEAIAGRLEKMPPKSTYFYPKVLTGLLFHSLKTS